MPIYENVSCSQCGKDFGPSDHGYSHCNSHRPLEFVFGSALREIIEAASDAEPCDLADIARRALSYQSERIAPAHRHPAYVAGYTWAQNPTRDGNPYERGTDDYAMWQLAVEDYGIWMRATGRSEIEEIVE